LLAVLGSGLVGCAADAAETGDAARSNVEPRAEALESLQPPVRVLADVPGYGFSFGQLTPNPVANASGVYWYEGNGAVFGQRRGESRVSQLRQGVERSDSETRVQMVIGMAADVERVYIGDAHLETGGVIDFFPQPDFEPPARLLSIPTQGGAATVLLELDDAIVTPIASNGTLLIVFVYGGASPGFYSVDESNPRLERLPVSSQFFSGRRVGDTLYVANNEYPPSLLRSSFYDPEPELVMGLENYDFNVGPRHVITRQERLLEPEYTREMNLVLHELETNRSRTLPSLGEAISSEAVDAEHAYWISYRTSDSTVAAGASGPDPKLIRASLATGALTRLELPDVSLDVGASIVGQDAETLYVANGPKLLAIQKP
jgi:hypothetical protein